MNAWPAGIAMPAHVSRREPNRSSECRVKSEFERVPLPSTRPGCAIRTRPRAGAADLAATTTRCHAGPLQIRNPLPAGSLHCRRLSEDRICRQGYRAQRALLALVRSSGIVGSTRLEALRRAFADPGARTPAPLSIHNSAFSIRHYHSPYAGLRKTRALLSRA